MPRAEGSIKWTFGKLDEEMWTGLIPGQNTWRGLVSAFESENKSHDLLLRPLLVFLLFFLK
jgi:hypothetical protein